MILFKNYIQAVNYGYENESNHSCGCGCGSGSGSRYEVRGNWLYKISTEIDLSLNWEEHESVVGFIWINDGPKSKQSNDDIVIPKGIMNYRRAT